MEGGGGEWRENEWYAGKIKDDFYNAINVLISLILPTKTMYWLLCARYQTGCFKNIILHISYSTDLGNFTYILWIRERKHIADSLPQSLSLSVLEWIFEPQLAFLQNSVVSVSKSGRKRKHSKHTLWARTGSQDAPIKTIWILTLGDNHNLVALATESCPKVLA